MSHQDRLIRLSTNLFWYRDTCNVYLLKHGSRGLLVDFGSGAVLDHLAEAGVDEVEWVLHTHHHRDQCQGDPLLNARGIPIAVPEREAALFAEAKKRPRRSVPPRPDGSASPSRCPPARPAGPCSAPT